MLCVYNIYKAYYDFFLLSNSSSSFTHIIMQCNSIQDAHLYPRLNGAKHRENRFIVIKIDIEGVDVEPVSHIVEGHLSLLHVKEHTQHTWCTSVYPSERNRHGHELA